MTAKRRSNLTYDHVANRPRPGRPYKDPPYTPDIERAMLAVAEAGFSVLAPDTWIDNLAVNSILIKEGCGVPRTDISIVAAMEKEGTLTSSGTLTPAGYRRLCQLRHPVAYWRGRTGSGRSLRLSLRPAHWRELASGLPT